MAKVSAIVVITLVALGAVAWWLAGDTNEASASKVDFQVGQGPVSRMSSDDAIARASAEAGFQVLVPAELPQDGLELKVISVEKGASGVPNALASVSLKWLSASAKDGGYYLEVLQFPVQIGPPDNGRQLSGVAPGVEAFIEPNNAGGSMITAFIGGRTFLAISTGDPQPTEAALIKTVSKFVEAP